MHFCKIVTDVKGTSDLCTCVGGWAEGALHSPALAKQTAAVHEGDLSAQQGALTHQVGSDVLPAHRQVLVCSKHSGTETQRVAQKNDGNNPLVMSPVGLRGEAASLSLHILPTVRWEELTQLRCVSSSTSGGGQLQ